MLHAQLHLQTESTAIEIDLPEAAPLRSMRARVDVYSNIDHIRWTATLGNCVAEVVSTIPDPRATLATLYTRLQNLVQQAAQC